MIEAIIVPNTAYIIIDPKFLKKLFFFVSEGDDDKL